MFLFTEPYKDEDGKFVCPVCGKKASSKQNINVHIRVHTGEKPYSCNVCGKQFTQKSNLNSHKIVHIDLGAEMAKM